MNETITLTGIATPTMNLRWREMTNQEIVEHKPFHSIMGDTYWVLEQEFITKYSDFEMSSWYSVQIIKIT